MVCGSPEEPHPRLERALRHVASKGGMVCATDCLCYRDAPHMPHERTATSQLSHVSGTLCPLLE